MIYNQTWQTNYEAMKIMGHDNQAVAAIVTFRSMEGVQRAKHAFMHSWIKKKLSDTLFTRCFKCCFKKDLQNIKFKDIWLDTAQSVEPELLLWQNYGVSKTQKCLRHFFFLICIIGLLSTSFYSVLYFEKLIYDQE